MNPIPKRLSFLRITASVLMVGIPVLALIAGLMLPRFIRLDTYRPEIQAQLQQESGRRVTLGALQANIFPPSISAETIVILAQIPPYRPILFAQQVVLRLRFMPLLHGAIQIHTAVIEKPRLILYTDRLLYAPAGTPSPSSATGRPSLKVIIHDGRIELDGPVWGQKIHWFIDNVEAEVEGTERRIHLSARPSFLGRSARLRVTFNPNAETPVHAELTKANLDSIFSMLGSTQATLWRGSRLDAQAEAQWPVMKRIDLRIDRLSAPAVPGAFAHGTLQVSTTTIRGTLDFEGLASSMTATGQFMTRRKGWRGAVRVERYSPEIMRLLMTNRWIHALEGPGSLQVTASRHRSGPNQISVTGSGFTFSGSRLEIPSWTLTEDGRELHVHVEAKTSDDQGRVKVHWSQSAFEPSGKIDVAVSSITVGDVLDVFALHASTPGGIESWPIWEGRCQGIVHPDERFEIEKAALTLDQMELQTSGLIDFSTAPAAVKIEGQATRVQLSPVLESLGAGPAPVRGLADVTYQLDFPAEARWIESLNGRMGVQSENGFIRAGKIIYKMAGYLNLNNLLKPTQQAKGTESGMPYQSASGNATIAKGVLEIRNVKIRTKNMNVSGWGEMDLPRHTLDAKIELQFLGFMKDRLSSIPLVKRVFTPDNGMLQVPLRIHGPLDNPKID